MTSKLITIEGNIGSGKSTIVNKLKEKYGDNKRICFLQEPVDIWNSIRDEDENTILSLYYENQKEYAFSFQMMAYISRLELLKNAIDEGYEYIVSERSLETDKNVFAKMLYDDRKIKHVEYQIYMKWFNKFKNLFNEENIVYIRTEPHVSFNRVNKRAREGENIPIEYLENCHKYHEEWIIKNENINCLLINGNEDIEKHPEIMEDWMTTIYEYILK
jgi:deoxyadenosine/deoxycytidine kinase